jgi:lysophospholipase L1-like esterase
VSSRRLTRTIFRALVYLLTLLVLEAGARLVLRLSEPDAAPIEGDWTRTHDSQRSTRDLLYRPDADLFFRLRPNLDLERTDNPRIFGLRTNALGLRGGEVEVEKPVGRTRVIAVGDSCTFGSGAATPETYPALLERRLREMRPDMRIEVVNAGVPGFSSFQALRWLETEGFALSPDVVLFATEVNDATIANAGRKRQFGASRQLSDREFAQALRGRGGLAMLALLARVRIALGVGGSSEPGDVKRRVSVEEYEANLVAFAEQSVRLGAVPVVLSWPLRNQARGVPPRTELEAAVVPYQQSARETARRNGVLFVDLAPTLAGRSDVFVDMAHLNAEGYGLVAERVADALEPVLAGPDRAREGAGR